MSTVGTATIAAAIFEGHRFARELGEQVAEIQFRREITELSLSLIYPEATATWQSLRMHLLY